MTADPYIDSLCSGCGKRLRVAAEYAGRKARCPHCQFVYTVPGQHTVSKSGCELPLRPPPAGDTWQVKSPDGLIYGPVSKVELDAWRDAGRITNRSQLLPSGGPQWLWAAEVYPELTLATAAACTGPPPLPTVHPYYAAGLAPHRGALVLGLAIAGVFTLCAAPSLIGLVLGLHDLRLMKQHKMDAAGRRLTIAGVAVSLGFVLLSVGGMIVGLTVWLR